MVTLDEVLKIQEENPKAVSFFKRVARHPWEQSLSYNERVWGIELYLSEDHYIESLKEKETKTKEMIKIDNYV